MTKEEKKKAYMKAYNKANRPKILKARQTAYIKKIREYQLANKDKISDQSKARYQKNQ